MNRIELNVDIEKLLKEVSDITYTPVSHFRKQNGEYVLTKSYPEITFLPTLAKNFPKSILCDKPAKIVETEFQSILYGYVNLPDGSFLILGPILEMSFDNNSAARFIKKLNLPLSEVKNFLDYYDSTSHYSIYRFAKIVKFICRLFNDEIPHTIDILPDGYKKEKTEQLDSETKKPTDRDTAIVKSQNYEKELYSYIYTGQYKQLKVFLDKVMYDEETAIYSPSIMRNNQYMVIISTALASRTASRAGANYDAAMKKADFYIKKTDIAQTFEELYDIHKHMLLDFAKLVSDSKIGKPVSALYLKVLNYVSDNLYEKITTADIAEALNLSRTYLSTNFKNETGINLADFINELKIDEAKRLLATTDKTLIWIANSLCFSSQSYFAEVFKKIVGCSPKEFRENPVMYHKISE